jgi:hypothetical protein
MALPEAIVLYPRVPQDYAITTATLEQFVHTTVVDVICPVDDALLLLGSNES